MIDRNTIKITLVKDSTGEESWLSFYLFSPIINVKEVFF